MSKKFPLPKLWVESCQRVPGPHNAAHWEHQNWCWEWMKHEGCYATTGALTWHEVQTSMAKKGFAPFPTVAPIEPLRQPSLCDRSEFGSEDFTSHQAEAARAWFTDMIDVFVVNLPSDKARLKAITTNLQGLGIEFQMVEGVNLMAPGTLESLRRTNIVPPEFNLSKAQEKANTDFQDMGGIVGTVGCATAHLRAMLSAEQQENTRKPLALILEDDVALEANFVPRLQQLVSQEVPCDWAAISLKSQCPFGECVSRHLTRVLPDVNVPEDRCYHGVNYGFYGMLYQRDRLTKLRETLSEVIWDEERPHCLDIDVALASVSDKVGYYAVPASQEPAFLSTGQLGSSRARQNGIKLNCEAVKCTAVEKEMLAEAEPWLMAPADGIAPAASAIAAGWQQNPLLGAGELGNPMDSMGEEGAAATASEPAISEPEGGGIANIPADQLPVPERGGSAGATVADEAPAPGAVAAGDEALAPGAVAADEETPAPGAVAASDEAPAPGAVAADDEAPAPGAVVASDEALALGAAAADEDSPAPGAVTANDEAPAPGAVAADDGALELGAVVANDVPPASGAGFANDEASTTSAPAAVAPAADGEPTSVAPPAAAPVAEDEHTSVVVPAVTEPMANVHLPNGGLGAPAEAPPTTTELRTDRPPPPPALLLDRASCAKYEEMTGCAWTSDWSCPGQQTGISGQAGNDDSLGYRCCCKYNGWLRSG